MEILPNRKVLTHKMKIDKPSIKKILLIKLRGIGDVILSTVVLENIKQEFPSAQIHFLTQKPSDQLIQDLPEINKVLLFDRKDLLGRIQLIRNVRKEKYDLVIDFYTNPFTAQVTFLSGAKLRAGFPYRGRKYAYNLYGVEERGKYHAADLHLEFIKKLGIETSSNVMKCDHGNAGEKFAKDFIANNFPKEKMVAGISPSGSWTSKKVPPEIFAEIADRVKLKYDCEILIVWGPEDETECNQIINSMKTKAVKAPSTNIKEMAALCGNVDFLIANDSGPMHIATALGTPVLSIHGPTDPKLQGPYQYKHEWINKIDLHCIICNLTECPYNQECFRELPVEDIIKKVETLIQKNNLLQKN